MNETLTTLNTRRSIRRYRPEQVRPETLDAILEAGTYAPSAMGKQSAVMAVVQDPETIALLSRLNAEIQGCLLYTSVLGSDNGMLMVTVSGTAVTLK